MYSPKISPILFLAAISILFVCPPTLSRAADSATLRWSDNSNNEMGFRIERNANGGTFIEIAATGQNITSVVDPVLNPDTQYCYRVRAFNQFGNSAYTNTACIKTPPTPPAGTPPNAPSNATVIMVSSPTPNPGGDPDPPRN